MSHPGPAKSCTTCPSYIAPNHESDQVRYFGKELSIPMCGRFGHVLGSHNSTPQQTANIAVDAADRCPEWNVPWDGEPDPDTPRGKFAHLDQVEVTEPNRKARSCSACVNFIDPDVMLNSFGIPFSGCFRYGKIIPPLMGRAYAKDCPSNDQDFNSMTPPVGGLKLMPHLLPNVTFIDLDGTLRMAERAAVDPAEYPTDAEVTEADKSCGIRAWRAIADPNGTGNSILLPVFSHYIFTPEEYAKIPRPGDEEHPELYQDHQGLAYKMGVLWLHMNETPALNGIAGVGKTEAYRYLAFLMQLPFERISITGSTELDDLAGRVVLEADESIGANVTRFQYGRLPKAWQKPCVVCLDEPNAGPSDVWQFIRPLTDNSKQMVIDMNKGERIDRHRFCFLGMAMNPSWDIRNVGTHQIADADGSRLMHIAVPPPSEDLEKEILIRRCKVDGYEIETPILDSIMKIAAELRELMSNGDTLSISWGTRQTIKVARATRWFTLKEAHRMAAADLVEPQESDRILAIVSSHEIDGRKYSEKDGKKQEKWF